MEELFAPAIVVFMLFAGVLLFTPYEAFFEGTLAVVLVVAAIVGFLMHPRKEVYYVRTSVRLVDPDRNQAVEHDFLAVRAQLVRLWLLFIPTALAVAPLVFLAAGGPTKFSFLNWFFSLRYGLMAASVVLYPLLLVVVLLSAWISERRVLRDAEACSARSFSVYRNRRPRWFGRVSYQFMGEHGEYYGGYCAYFGFAHPRELASIVFHNVRKPELNKIAMGFMFHRFIVVGRGVTELDKQTLAAQRALAEMTSSS